MVAIISYVLFLHCYLPIREYSLLFCKSGKMVNCGWQVVTSGLSNREEGGS